MEKIIIPILIAVIWAVFIVLPASLGYWYMSNSNDAFKIPLEHWLPPLIASVVVYLLVLYLIPRL